eukprot:CAMPEP_0198212428 /NCGR_PEP_ID=MMETSP1445-20131203/26005_1 /TAXON_ID=36898 /ORGANISM="Pyramimonas sp., Strain CCMP2087" /LENGTH=135 /DNA_ID=CAMNT_0043886863 /DNA_START=156 /DNA_END=563 /DNA_ORIENTATION=+
MGRPQVLSSYRELRRLIRRLPVDKQPSAMLEASTTMRKHSGETDDEKALEYHKVLTGKIGWLRMTTPKRATDKYGGGHFVVREGKLVDGEGSDVQGRRAADGKMDMNDAYKKNAELTKRQYFGRMPEHGGRERMF